MGSENNAPWFFEERALAFAKLVVTEEQDVRPVTGGAPGIDLLVEIRTKVKGAQPRLFGVQIVPFMDLPRIKKLDEQVISRLDADAFEGSFPLCVFAIGVRKPEGLYRWVVEPIVVDGLPAFDRATETGWQPLDQAGIARLVAQVDAWYDSRSEASPQNANGRPSRARSH